MASTAAFQAGTADGCILRDQSLCSAFLRSASPMNSRNGRYRYLPLPGSDGYRVPGARKYHRHSADEVRNHGRAHRCRRRLSRIDGWKTGRNIGIQELAGGTIRALRSATTGDVDCKENAGAKGELTMERRVSPPVFMSVRNMSVSNDASLPAFLLCLAARQRCLHLAVFLSVREVDDHANDEPHN